MFCDGTYEFEHPTGPNQQLPKKGEEEEKKKKKAKHYRDLFADLEKRGVYFCE
jgi:hypothetical protein